MRISKDTALTMNTDQVGQKDVSLERNINWRDALTAGLGKSNSHIESERAWGCLCSSMRELCPETEWISLTSEQALGSAKEQVRALQSWLENLVGSAEWPFPKKVMLIAELDNWKIVFEKSTKLPFIIPPSNLTVSPWRDLHSTGWKVQAINSYNVSKVGEA